MKMVSVLMCSVSLLILSGCANPADDVPAAKVAPTAPTSSDEPASTEAAPAGDAYTFSADGSKIDFVGSKITGSHTGGFEKFTGEIVVADGAIAGNGIDVAIDTTSLFSDNPKLTDHLKTPDFFDVEQFPTATFKSTAVEGSGDSANITGDLTLHGITRTITVPAKISVGQDKVTLTSEFSLNRLDFEMKYPGKPDDLIRKEVVVKLNINATPKSGA